MLPTESTETSVVVVRADNWEHNTILTTDKITLGGYTDGYPCPISDYLLWLRKLCSPHCELPVKLYYENWVLKYFLSICRHQRLHYVISCCTIIQSSTPSI
jgi:hypothetical protein